LPKEYNNFLLGSIKKKEKKGDGSIFFILKNLSF